MTKFLFAVAAVALIASVGAAEEKPVVPQPRTVVVPDGTSNTILLGEQVGGTPVVVGAPTPVVEYATPAAPARRGLFGRLRNRNADTTMKVGSPGTLPLSGTTVVTPGTVVAPAPMPMPPVGVPQPMPSPVVKPIGGTVVPGTSGVVVAGGPTPPGTVVVAGSTMPAEMMMPAMPSEAMTASSAPARRGLFGRLRNR